MGDETFDQRQQFIHGLRERSVAAFESGNQLGGSYLACICGMWAHTMRVEGNPFQNDATRLYSDFIAGHGAALVATKKPI